MLHTWEAFLTFLQTPGMSAPLTNSLGTLCLYHRFPTVLWKYLCVCSCQKMFSQITLKHGEFCLEYSDTHSPHRLHETYLLIFSLLFPLLYLTFISSFLLLCILEDFCCCCLIKVYSSLALMTFIQKFHNEILRFQTLLPAFLFTLDEAFLS